MSDGQIKTEKVMRRYGIKGIELKAGRMAEYLERMKQRRRWAGLGSTAMTEEPWKAASESLGMLEVLKADEARTVVDLGSGGGLVGITCALACPAWEVTLVESARRKCAFLAETKGAMGMKNVEVVCARAESLAGKRTFDVAVSRAVGTVREVAELAMVLLGDSGLYISFKGTDGAAELELWEAGEEGLWKTAGIVQVPPPEEGGVPGASLVVMTKM